MYFCHNNLFEGSNVDTIFTTNYGTQKVSYMCQIGESK